MYVERACNVQSCTCMNNSNDHDNNDGTHEALMKLLVVTVPLIYISYISI